MIHVTARAAQHLIGVRARRGFSQDAGARFIRVSNGVGMSFLGAPRPGDDVLSAHGIDLYVGPDVARKLEGSTLDVRERDGRADLILRPPRISHPS